MTTPATQSLKRVRVVWVIRSARRRTLQLDDHENNGQFTAKSPNFKNQLGYDAGEIDATGKIANNATSASFKATSTGDIYFPTALTFATELFSPAADAQKSVTDINGQHALPNDVLQYNLALKNDTTAETGDVSSNTVITDRFPDAATTFRAP